LDLKLADITNVGKTTIFSTVGGGRRLQLKMRFGRARRLWVNELDEWIETIRAAKDAEARGIEL
jgi:hypothetical protein